MSENYSICYFVIDVDKGFVIFGKLERDIYGSGMKVHWNFFMIIARTMI